MRTELGPAGRGQLLASRTESARLLPGHRRPRDPPPGPLRTDPQPRPRRRHHQRRRRPRPRVQHRQKSRLRQRPPGQSLEKHPAHLTRVPPRSAWCRPRLCFPVSLPLITTRSVVLPTPRRLIPASGTTTLRVVPPSPVLSYVPPTHHHAERGATQYPLSYSRLGYHHAPRGATPACASARPSNPSPRRAWWYPIPATTRSVVVPV